MTTLWVVLSVVVILGGLAVRIRLRGYGADDPVLDDDEIRRIEEEGSAWFADEDHPLDVEAAEEAERRFWEEDWEDPEEW